MSEQITRVRSLDERYKELEEEEFQLKMKDTWSNSDSQRMSKIIAEMGEIKRKMEWLDAQP